MSLGMQARCRVLTSMTSWKISLIRSLPRNRTLWGLGKTTGKEGQGILAKPSLTPAQQGSLPGSTG